MFGWRDIRPVLLPRLAGGDEDDLVEVQERLDLAGSDQVAMVDGIEGPTHHPDPLDQWWPPLGLECLSRTL